MTSKGLFVTHGAGADSEAAEGVQQRGGLEADDGLDRGFHDLQAVCQDAEPATAGLD